ncbi:MAG: UDP-N-acetylglucosamine 2-epimerase [Firmicutes bacterium]|nr:UDP-N-acetylglucosamine 2-epimerase [Bacillota bacterium]MCM1401453.1 UDP-N-acetylglucosamine 2-epimerase [Bacteroides sp.]MCM1476811.1 UDP-N-acetylglucosamine 2-epimerase [Bacteroides sp.]
MKRKVCIVTGTRAEWGLLSPIAAGLKQRDDVELQIVATNMHLLQRYGHTIDTIRAEGFTVCEEVPMEATTDSPADTAVAMGRCTAGMADAFARIKPDMVVILGDRYEMLAVASAAAVMRIPIVHLHGGEVSEGAIDDSIRHAITKLSALHLTSAETHRRRVIQMGENPDMVFNIGAVGVANVLAVEPLPKEDLESFLGVNLNRRSLIVTYHPATACSQSPAQLFGNLLEALEKFPDSNVVFTYPNNDARGAAIIGEINDFVRSHPGRAVAFPSLGMKRYLSALHYVGAAVGNSSSGIIEVPSMGIPTVDIGPRQSGRLAAESVIHCSDTVQDITDSIRRALSDEMQQFAAHAVNPYSKPGTVAEAVRLIAETPLVNLRHKSFHDF